MVESSTKLETSLSAGNFEDFCQAKLSSVGEGEKAKVWQFIGASFKDQVDQEFLNLLGIQLNELSAQLRTLLQVMLVIFNHNPDIDQSQPTKQPNGDLLSTGDNLLASNISGLNLDVSQVGILHFFNFWSLMFFHLRMILSI